MTALASLAIWAAGTAVVALFTLEYMLRGVLRLCAHLLPDELCGPDGWLVDTRARRGVFDRPHRRQQGHG